MDEAALHEAALHESVLHHLLQSKKQICSYPPKNEPGQREILWSTSDLEVNDQC